MVNKKNKKINKTDRLVEIIATNVFKIKNKVDNIEKDVVELKESNQFIRKDILNLGERFPSRFAFDELSSRVYNLEKKRK
jgi:hypothetical protein